MQAAQDDDTGHFDAVTTGKKLRKTHMKKSARESHFKRKFVSETLEMCEHIAHDPTNMSDSESESDEEGDESFQIHECTACHEQVQCTPS